MPHRPGQNPELLCPLSFFGSWEERIADSAITRYARKRVALAVSLGPERPEPRRGTARRLNWPESFSRAQSAPTKGPSLLNQRLGATHGGAGEARGAGGVGSPTHPVMPNLVVLWKMSPLRGGVRAGARLWARGPACRSWAAAGPKPKPGGGGLVGPRARCGGRRGG
jgi:hypothetical protein